jgi:hypothetical protein
MLTRISLVAKKKTTALAERREVMGRKVDKIIKMIAFKAM